MSDIFLMSKPHFEFGNILNHSSLSVPNKISHPVKASLSEHADPQSYSRAIAKISSLERNIERLNQNHASVLKDLYAEVENLQNTISDLTLKKAKSGLHLSFNDVRKVDATSLPRVDEPQESIYILLQEQKTKYRGIIDRLSQDNKRKTNTIESLTNQIDLIKKALSLAGLELDMKELQSLVSSRVKDKADVEKLEERANKADKAYVFPRPPFESDSVKTYLSLSADQNRVNKAGEETMSQIKKAYIERILAQNRESTSYENISKKKNVIHLNKHTKESNLSLDNQESVQEALPIAESPKSTFNQKEPLPPICIEEKDQESTQEIDQKKSNELDVHFEAFETASLNRWKNYDDKSMSTENQSILELLNGNKSINTDRPGRERFREKKSKG